MKVLNISINPNYLGGNIMSIQTKNPQHSHPGTVFSMLHSSSESDSLPEGEPVVPNLQEDELSSSDEPLHSDLKITDSSSEDSSSDSRMKTSRPLQNKIGRKLSLASRKKAGPKPPSYSPRCSTIRSPNLPPRISLSKYITDRTLEKTIEHIQKFLRVSNELFSRGELPKELMEKIQLVNKFFPRFTEEFTRAKKTTEREQKKVEALHERCRLMLLKKERVKTLLRDESLDTIKLQMQVINLQKKVATLAAQEKGFLQAEQKLRMQNKKSLAVREARIQKLTAKVESFMKLGEDTNRVLIDTVNLEQEKGLL